MLPALLAPIISTLASNGLNILAGAITAKGKEFIEDKIGMKIPTAENLTPELIAQLKMKEMEHETALIELSIKKMEVDNAAEQIAQENVTRRWESDMASDSYLSKNIRPLALIYILVVYTLFSLLSAAGIDVNENYVKLLGEWGMMIMSAYFVGRTVEKGISMFKKGAANVDDQ